MLKVYKASAGSGKTFQLVAEYILLLMKNPANYKHILAVTFTNKATNEMKSRILEQLFCLAKNKKSDYLELIQNETNLPEPVVSERSKMVLKNILHDYNRFSVSTIDSFTQRVIKAFNRELGISPNFSIELDESLVLEEAVDRLIAKIDTDKNLRKWLIDFNNEKISESRNKKLEDEIKELGKELFNEQFQVFFPEEGKNLFTREVLKKFKKELDKIALQFENTLKLKGESALSTLEKHGVQLHEFMRGETGFVSIFKKFAEGNVKEPTKTVFDAAEDSEKWLAKSNKKRNEILPLVESIFRPLLVELLSYYETHKTLYFSAIVVRNELRILGILIDLKEEIKILLNEKGWLQISDSNLLLSKIIGGSETPFVYEKIGNYFNYFMLDEFQDTSALQWSNFKPLVANSMAEGNQSLIVGDVKQSIYRWRNSDWNILAEQLFSDFPNFVPELKNLDKNWRSDAHIIDFNNAIIQQLKSTFSQHLFSDNDSEEWQRMNAKFETIYHDFHQKQGKQNAEKSGWVKVNFMDKEDFSTKSIQLLINEVKTLQDKGLAARDIAILIRRNREGTKIIEAFLEEAKQNPHSPYNLSVLSNESLFLHASKAVLFVIYIIEILLDKNNKISKAAALHLWFSSLKPEIQKNSVFTDSEQIKQTKNNGQYQPENWQIPENFEEVFEQELGTFLLSTRQNLMFSSVDESLSEICGIFGLFTIDAEIPFLQTLIDKSGELKNSVANDLSNFLLWWNEKGKKTSVSVNEEVDSIRLLTVHKSKGLEFKAVIIPELNWDTGWGSFSPTLWCSSASEPFNALPLFPVKATSKLENTIFKSEYIVEKASYFIDVLNLVYVAFTRAKSALFIHATNTDKPGKSVNSLLKVALENLTDFENSWNEDHTFFEFGNLLQNTEIQKASNSVLLEKYYYSDFKTRLKLRLSSDGFLETNENKKTAKNLGKIVHEILSEISTKQDLETACMHALNQGKINTEEKENLFSFLQNKFENPDLEEWFNGSLKVINERSVLTSTQILRPDRIMISGNSALVVDYKIGSKKMDKYNEQVANYAQFLKESGFEKVEAFLWYVYLNEVEKVGEY